MIEENSLIGKQFGRYRVTNVLSTAGGFAVVYLAKHTTLTEKPSVVIKLLRRGLTSSKEEEEERFRQEAHSLELLEHKYALC